MADKISNSAVSVMPRVNRLDSPPASPPAIPQRSPLRPPAKARVKILDDQEMPLSFLSSPSITALIEPEQKFLPVRPDSPLALSPLEDEPASSNSSFTMSKRQHALLELLESERAYASDLALVREVHIPLALGKYALLQTRAYSVQARRLLYIQARQIHQRPAPVLSLQPPTLRRHLSVHR